MKLLLPILFITLAVTASSQTKGHYLYTNDSAKLNMKFLTGSWTIVTDTIKVNIQFTTNNGDFYLLDSSAYSYYFFNTDSFPLSGISMTWPPHDCVVRKIDKNTIEVQYTLFGGKPIVLRYRRKLLTVARTQGPEPLYKNVLSKKHYSK